MKKENERNELKKDAAIIRITKDNLQSLAGDIVGNPKEWVLILGENISFCMKEAKGCAVDARQRFRTKMVRKVIRDNRLNPYDTDKMYEAVQNKDKRQMETLLFGNVWDGASFADRYREMRLERRERLAEKLPSVDRMNVEFAKWNVNHSLQDDSFRLINLLNSIILTTCQDETAEAVLEYERAMPIDGLNVCTPYSMLTSPKWQRRLNSCLGTGVLPACEDNNTPVLVKLYGRRSNPKRMLLSEWDFDAYYPPDYECEMNEPYTMSFLETVFCSKNLLFIGVNEAEGNKTGEGCDLDMAPGIVKLLEKTKKSGKSRFALVEDERSAFLNLLSALEAKVKTLFGRTAAREEQPGEAEPKELDIKTAEQYFWELYTRRPGHKISLSEKQVLKEQILGKDGRQLWGVFEVETLAIVANKLADFYDLKEVLDEEWEAGNQAGGPADNFASVPMRIIEKSLNKSSAVLFRALLIYGGGFPSGFLELISCDGDSDGDKEDVKRSAIRLVNNGLCSKGQQRKNIHKRMKYADSIMRTAGNNRIPDRATFKSDMEEVDRQVNDSYLYLTEIFTKTNRDLWKEYEDEALDGLGAMCDRLMQILEQKSRGYSHYRSLLETEIPLILGIVPKLKKSSAWKTDFVYCLFKESRLVKKELRENGDVNRLLNSLMEQLCADYENRHIDEERFYRCKAKNLISQSIVWSQSGSDRFQKKALRNCRKALFWLKNLKGHAGIDRDFLLKVNIYFLCAKIYGRRSTIRELKRCANGEATCPTQWELMLKMKENLDEIKQQTDMYNDSHPLSYNGIKARLDYLYGEYFFKMSQYHKENRQYGAPSPDCEGRETESCYTQAKNYYDDAFDFYNRYPELYSLEAADVHRSIGDYYCQKAKSDSMFGGGSALEISAECFENLYAAFKIYRLNTNLHGIADVLQSMGNTQSYGEFNVKIEKNKRSSFCFYNASKELYQFLGDEWSISVLGKFLKGAKMDREEALREALAQQL